MKQTKMWLDLEQLMGFKERDILLGLQRSKSGLRKEENVLKLAPAALSKYLHSDNKANVAYCCSKHRIQLETNIAYVFIATEQSVVVINLNVIKLKKAKVKLTEAGWRKRKQKV